MSTRSHQVNRRQLLGLVGSLTATGAVAACGTTPAERAAGGSSPGAPKQDGTITAAISYELGTNGFDPATTSAALTVAANWHTLEGLTEISPTGDRAVRPALGRTLPTKIDDTTYEVALRDGATFHDGSPVTADDVVHSFRRVQDPATESLYAQFIPFVSSVTRKDERTVTIRLSEPSTLLAQRLSVVKIVPEAAVKADPKAFDAKPIGTGPWRMTDNSATSKQLRFERFDGYTGNRPARAREMTWRVMPDDGTRMNALTSRTVQAMDLVPDLSITTLGAGAKVDLVQGFSLLFAMFNCASPAFRDVRNRQAVLHAFDVDKVVRTAYLGHAEPATSFLQRTHPDYQRAATVYTTDRARAKALLAQTGLRQVRMLCTDHAWVQKATPLLKSSLEAVGLSVAFEQRKSADLYNSIDGKPDAYDLVIAPGDPSVFGADPALLLSWWFANDVWTDGRMHWKGRPEQRRLQDLLGQATKQTGAAQRATWKQLFDLVSAQVPLYPLFHRQSATGYDSSTLVGFEPVPTTGLSFLGTASTR